MIVLIDTDVLIDVALERKRHVDSASALLDALEQRQAGAFVAWHSISNFYYLVQPTRGRAGARQFVLDLTSFIDVAPTTTTSLRFAASVDMKDFEDAMQVAAAMACGADVIATRNIKDYAKSPVKAATPKEVLAMVTSQKSA